MNVWYFREGTEERVPSMVFLDKLGHEYAMNCPLCGINFTLRQHDHGVTVGPDGALSAEHSFNCPKCMNWHRHVRGGVIQP